MKEEQEEEEKEETYGYKEIEEDAGKEELKLQRIEERKVEDTEQKTETGEIRDGGVQRQEDEKDILGGEEEEKYMRRRRRGTRRK